MVVMKIWFLINTLVNMILVRLVDLTIYYCGKMNLKAIVNDIHDEKVGVEQVYSVVYEVALKVMVSVVIVKVVISNLHFKVVVIRVLVDLREEMSN